MANEEKLGAEDRESVEADNVRTISSWLSWYIAGASDTEWLGDVLDEVKSALQSSEKTAAMAANCDKVFAPGGTSHLPERHTNVVASNQTQS